MSAKRTVTVVCPVHNEAENIEPLVARLGRAADRMPGADLDLVLVDDGSSDDTAERIAALRGRGWAIGLVVLSRNFGHQAALDAGMQAASGAWIITMDGDLQHPPEEIPRMLAARDREQADVVQMVRSRARPVSGAFYRWSNRLAHARLVPDASDFRLMSRRVVDVLLAIPEREKLFRGLIPSLGFRQVSLPFDEGERQGGRASYTMATRWWLARKALFDFSTMPLGLVSRGGAILMITSLVFAVGRLIVKLAARESVAPGITDLVTVIVFLSGTILAAIGILGRYLLMILEQLRGRPTFVVSEREPGGPLSVPPSERSG